MKRLFLFLFIILLSAINISYAKAETSPKILYKVAINDVLVINVLNNRELNSVNTVASDGTINLFYIGTLYVKDKTVSQIEKDITEALKGYVNYPVVTVKLEQSRTKKIYLFGETIRVGDISYEEGMTVLVALSKAGGLTVNGRYGTIKVRRKQEDSSVYKDIIIDFERIVEYGAGADILLQPNDIIIAGRNQTYFVHGEINKPGEYALKDGLRMLRAISEAGGVTENGRHGLIRVRRRQQDNSVVKDIVVNIQGIEGDSITEDILLKPDDEIIIERNKTYFIHGEINKPGEYVLEKGLSLVRAISIAGGMREDGLYGKVKVRRKDVSISGYREIEIDLMGAEANSNGDLVLQPDDEVIIKKNDEFFIYGEVNKPGRYDLEYNITVFEALILAGGFSKWGSPDRVMVLRSTEKISEFSKIKVNIKDVIDGDMSKDLLLQPGDVIVVSSGIL